MLLVTKSVIYTQPVRDCVICELQLRKAVNQINRCQTGSEVTVPKRTEDSHLVPLLTALSLPGRGGGGVASGPPASSIILAGLTQTLSPEDIPYGSRPNLTVSRPWSPLGPCLFRLFSQAIWLLSPVQQAPFLTLAELSPTEGKTRTLQCPPTPNAVWIPHSDTLSMIRILS